MGIIVDDTVAILLIADKHGAHEIQLTGYAAILDGDLVSIGGVEYRLFREGVRPLQRTSKGSKYGQFHIIPLFRGEPVKALQEIDIDDEALGSTEPRKS